MEILKKLIWRPLFKSYKKIRKWYELTFVIPTYIKKREIILMHQRKYNCVTFVETGTFLGDTVEAVKKHFNNIHSIELSEKLFTKAKNRFAHEDKIHIHHGDSGQLMNKLLTALSPPILFWLDGHYSSSFFISGEFIQTARGDQLTPILLELEVILEQGLGSNVILIDDARLFNGKNDYPSFSSLKHFLLRKGIQPLQIKKEFDIIRIIPNA